MSAAIVSHTLRYDEAAGFDFETYLRCKRYLRPRDARLADVLAETIVTRCLTNRGGKLGSQILSLLDVGSGDGLLIEAVINSSALTNRNQKFTIDCIEPEPSVVPHTLATTARLRAAGISASVKGVTVQEWSRLCMYQYDAVLACHSLYHINENLWPQTLRTLIGMLTTDGLALVDLISSNSDVFHVLPAVNHLADSLGLHRPTTRYGHVVFAEDLDSVVQNLDCSQSQIDLHSSVTFDSDTVRFARQAMDSSKSSSRQYRKSELPILVTFLAFMLRLEPLDLLAYGIDAVRLILPRPGDSLTLNFVERIHILGRR